MEITEPLTDLRSTLDQYSDRLKTFDPAQGNGMPVWSIGRELTHLAVVMRARQRGGSTGCYSWQFDQFGLTDLTHESEGERRYLVFLDVHS